MSQAGQHQKEDHDEVVAAIKAIPFHKCTAYRKLASAFAKIHSKFISQETTDMGYHLSTYKCPLSKVDRGV